jgi:two-component system NtrC family response regulator
MTSQPFLLVVEDDRLLNRLLLEDLRRMGYEVEGAHSWAEARTLLGRRDPSLIITDVRLPDVNTMDILPTLASEHPVIVLTAYSTVQEAVAAMKAGAMEYLAKPFNPDELELKVERVLAHSAMQRDHQFCKSRLRPDPNALMVGDSPAMAEVQHLIDAVAAADATVLVLGESGSGKELVANAIHARSPRAARNFVAVDCCTLQEKLFESELFGHEKGAFTGAERQKPGLIEAASGGTLFLDEIGEIEPAIQAKLLRVLETGQYRRLGGVKDLQANVRIVAATNRDLMQMGTEGRFRMDLYYRLTAFSLRIPPLRERLQDIPKLVQHILAHHDFSRRYSKRVSPAAMRLLMDYSYPGNVRELRNMIERAVILSGASEEIRPEHFSLDGAAERPAQVELRFEHDPSLEEIEKRYLETLLNKYDGHRSRIAEIIGVSERNIYRLLEKYGLK